ncbi:hypothetical protein ACFPYI_14530 [Halomarina salina]|uniref:Uncharacterized protein n=1 Tax=Halomarina salina TaxID=1872699 RepID=A0ABD5RQA9_9EURY|nr:hypothetical protein [Halomarina salina]
MNANRPIVAMTVAGVLLVVAVAVVAHELGLRGVAAFALPLAVGVVVGGGIVAVGATGEE